MELKFNAWDKQEKKMIFWYDLTSDLELIPEVLSNNKRYITLLFTSEYTKDNEEIYFGDICKCRYYKHSEPDLYLIQEVHFDKGSFTLNSININVDVDSYTYGKCPISWADEKIKKIGNIYEGLKIDL